MEENNHDCSIFTLRITGVDLQDMRLQDLAQVMSDFSKLLDEQSARFKAISQGSVVLDVLTAQSAFPDVLENIGREINQAWFRPLRKYAPNLGLQVWAKKNQDAPKQMVRAIEIQDETQIFEQHETIRGKLVKSEHGKGKNDHFALLMPNGKSVSVKLNKMLSDDLAQHLTALWREECWIIFTGKAKYQMQGLSCHLANFYAESFEILEQQSTLQGWLEAFTKAGQSGWQEIENAEALWLLERHQ